MHRYRLLERIGAGGQSEVYKTLDTATGKVCALKFMKEPYRKQQKVQGTELSLINRLSRHPNIVKLLDDFIEDGHLIMVFELMDNSLIDFYKSFRQSQKTELPEDHIRKIIYQVAGALEAIHKVGYVHRDIKPENVLIRQDGQKIQAKLIDFGVTKKIDAFNKTCYVATRWYRAPEMLLGLQYNEAVDVFALGCLFAQLYNGLQIFRGATEMEQLHLIFDGLGWPQQSWRDGIKALRKMGIEPKRSRKEIGDLVSRGSEEGLDLLEQMLQINPAKRIKISDVLRHSFFQENESQLRSIEGRNSATVLPMRRVSPNRIDPKPKYFKNIRSNSQIKSTTNHDGLKDMTIPITDLKKHIKLVKSSQDKSFVRAHSSYQNFLSNMSNPHRQSIQKDRVKLQFSNVKRNVRAQDRSRSPIQQTIKNMQNKYLTIERARQSNIMTKNTLIRIKNMMSTERLSVKKQPDVHERSVSRVNEHRPVSNIADSRTIDYLSIKTRAKVNNIMSNYKMAIEHVV